MGGNRPSKGVTTRDGAVVSCLFCRIASGEQAPGRRGAPGRLLHADDRVVAFHPRDPAALRHVLVIPRAHIANVSALRADHAGLLEHMRATGRAVIAQERARDAARASAGAATPAPAPVPEQAPATGPPVAATGGAGSAAAGTVPRGGATGGGEGDGDDGLLFVFHVPPFNSIEHLHVHVFEPPFHSTWYRVSYSSNMLWAASMDHTLRQLRGGAGHGQAASAAGTAAAEGRARGAAGSASRL